MSVDFTHTDYTEELNRIIVALTGIRNDIRLLRKTVEDPEQGIATSHVMNDMQKAMMSVALSSAGAGNAEVVRQRVEAGTGATLNAGTGVVATGTSQENISKVVAGAPPTADDIDPSIGDKRWPAERAEGSLALPAASANADLINPATGEVQAVDKATQTSNYLGDATPTPAAPRDVKAAQTERQRLLEKLGQPIDDPKTIIRVSGQYYFEAEATDGPDDGLRGTIPQIQKFVQGAQLGYQSKSGSGGAEDYGHDAAARSSLGSVT